MAFDGITTAALTAELKRELTDGRISKIAQPHKDELLITVRRERGQGQIKLYLSANPSLPLCYLTEENLPSPDQAPAFCMLLRKYLTGGRFLSVSQPSLERVIRFSIEHRNEMGDMTVHTLLIELMGKHSNIILTQEENGKETIVDSIRHVSSMVSSVREVLPGREYFIPETMGKADPLACDKGSLVQKLQSEEHAHKTVRSFLQNAYQGISAVTAVEISSGIPDADRITAGELDDNQAEALWKGFSGIMDLVRAESFTPYIYYRENAFGAMEPYEYSAFPLRSLEDLKKQEQSCISEMLIAYYGEKNRVTRVKQRSADLRKQVSTLLERAVHKYDLQMKQMQDTEKREKDRLYGELILANAYMIPEGADECEVENYYTGEKIRIKLDPDLTAAENATRYYDRYAKRKRTKQALESLMEEGKQQIEELKGIRTALDFASAEEDLSEIRKELEDEGYIRKAAPGGKQKKSGKSGGKDAASQPMHYLSSDGFDIYVGKNNIQNDHVSFGIGQGNDLWFHANDMPGSHVIVKTNGIPMERLPDRLFEEAASLAAYYSAGRNQSKVEIDYLERHNLKKPSGAKPGFVVYYTNYSIVARPDISGLETAGT